MPQGLGHWSEAEVLDESREHLLQGRARSKRSWIAAIGIDEILEAARAVGWLFHGTRSVGGLAAGALDFELSHAPGPGRKHDGHRAHVTVACQVPGPIRRLDRSECQRVVAGEISIVPIVYRRLSGTMCRTATSVEPSVATSVRGRANASSSISRAARRFAGVVLRTVHQPCWLIHRQRCPRACSHAKKPSMPSVMTSGGGL